MNRLNENLFFFLNLLEFKDRYEFAQMMENSPLWLSQFTTEASNLNKLLPIGLLPVFNFLDPISRMTNKAGFLMQLKRKWNAYYMHHMNVCELFMTKNVKSPKKTFQFSDVHSDFLMDNLNEEMNLVFAINEQELLRPVHNNEPITIWSPIYSVSALASETNFQGTLSKFLFCAFDTWGTVPVDASVNKMMMKMMTALIHDQVGLDLNGLCNLVHLYRKLKAKKSFSSIEYDKLIDNMTALLAVPLPTLQAQISQTLNKNKFTLFFLEDPKKQHVVKTADFSNNQSLKGVLREKVETHSTIVLDSLKVKNPLMFYLDLSNSQILYNLEHDSHLKESVERLLFDNGISYSKNVVDFPIVYDFIISKGFRKTVIMVMDDTKHYLNVPNLLMANSKLDLAVIEAEKTDCIRVYANDLLNPAELLQKIRGN